MLQCRCQWQFFNGGKWYFTNNEHLHFDDDNCPHYEDNTYLNHDDGKYFFSFVTAAGTILQTTTTNTSTKSIIDDNIGRGKNTCCIGIYFTNSKYFVLTSTTTIIFIMKQQPFSASQICITVTESLSITSATMTVWSLKYWITGGYNYRLRCLSFLHNLIVTPTTKKFCRQ